MKTGQRMKQLDTVLLFDVEDIFSPPEMGNDDSIRELAENLEAEGLRGTFLFIADRAAQLAEEGATMSSRRWRVTRSACTR